MDDNRASVRRILCIPSSAGLSHLHRLILVADELRRRGHVTAFGFGGPTDALSRSRHRWFRVRDPKFDDFQANLFASFADTRLTEQCLDDQRQAIDEFRADIVVTDLHPVASIAARLAGRPLVSVLNGYLTEYFDATGHFIDPVRHPVKYRCADWLIRLVLLCQKRALAAPFRRAARRHGVRDKSTLYQFLAGDLTLIADLPDFCPLRALPSHHRIIGPLIWEAPAGGPAVRTVGGRTNSLYVTIGNTGSSDLLELVTRAFGGDPAYHITMTTGAYVDPNPYAKHSNIDCRRFVPGSEAMSGRSLVIHCGGNGTTYQCLANGLPAIAVPFNNDQRINARLIHRSGVGLGLNPVGLEASRLKQAVHHVSTTDRYRAKALAFQSRLVPTAGPIRAADAILGSLGIQQSEERARAGSVQDRFSRA